MRDDVTDGFANRNKKIKKCKVYIQHHEIDN